MGAFEIRTEHFLSPSAFLVLLLLQHQGHGKIKGFDLVPDAKGRATIEKLDGAAKPPYRVVIVGRSRRTDGRTASKPEVRLTARDELGSSM